MVTQIMWPCSEGGEGGGGTCSRVRNMAIFQDPSRANCVTTTARVRSYKMRKQEAASAYGEIHVSMLGLSAVCAAT